jgi:hypothetical protein
MCVSRLCRILDLKVVFLSCDLGFARLLLESGVSDLEITCVVAISECPVLHASTSTHSFQRARAHTAELHTFVTVARARLAEAFFFHSRRTVPTKEHHYTLISSPFFHPKTIGSVHTDYIGTCSRVTMCSGLFLLKTNVRSVRACVASDRRSPLRRRFWPWSVENSAETIGTTSTTSSGSRAASACEEKTRTHGGTWPWALAPRGPGVVGGALAVGWLRAARHHRPVHHHPPASHAFSRRLPRARRGHREIVAPGRGGLVT